MKKLLFLFLAVTLLTACDEKATDDSLSVSKDLLEFKPEGGTQEFQIFSNTGWKIIVADENSEVYLSATSGHGNTTISVTLSGGRITETTTRLIVRSDDGASLKNVKLIQHGYSGNNVILNISNVDKYLIMNGTAYSEDSLTIHTNVPWQLKGPEWIEVYNGKEWVKLSMEHANITGNATMKSASGQNDTYDLKIRCASENADEEDRNGTIILESTYTKDKGDEITVSQLGRLRVNADALVLAHDMAWAWKYGKDVATIKYRVGTQSYQNFITEDEMKNWATAQPDLICCTYNLKASTAYFIYAYGLDAAGGGFNGTWEAAGCITQSDINQPLTYITAVYYNDKGDIGIVFDQNEYSMAFYTLAVPSSSDYAYYPDGLLAWYFYKNLHDVTTTSYFTMYSYRTMIFPFNYNQHMQFISWSLAPETYTLSGLLERYDTSRKLSAPSYVTSDEPKYQSTSLDQLEELKKSVILVKK